MTARSTGADGVDGAHRAWPARMDEPSPAPPNGRFRPTLRHPWSRRLALFGPTLIVLLLGAMMLGGVRRATANARAVERSYQVTVALERALSSLKDAETSQRGYVLTGDEAYLAPARNARPRIARELAEARMRIASAAQRGRVDALEPLIDQRLDLVEQIVELRRTRGRDAAEAVIRAGGGKALMDTVRVRVAEIEREQDALLTVRSQRERRGADSLSLLLAGAVIASAVLALMGNLLFAGQARSEAALAAGLRDRADDEAALHTLARALAQALSVREVLECVAGSAVRSTRAFGAYIERAEAHEVRVVAGAGEGIPELGTTAPYPGSLTDEIIDSGKPALALQASDIGESMAPYLRRSCERCGGLMVPLQTGKELLGALVLLRTDEQGAFGDREVRHARALGDLAVAALRRVLVLEAEQAARAQAEAAVQTRDQVLRVVSHDLKNPVHTIRMAAQFLQETPDLPEPQRQRQLDVVVRATGRMNRLIMDLLDAARLQAGHALAVDPAPVRPADLLADVMDAFRTQVADRGQQLACGAPEPLPQVMADRDRVFQVLSNLVGNAVKFTPQGGQIGVSAAPGADGAVCFTVRDTGSGIPAENLPHLFDPFWQASSTAGLGTGLGLAIARGLVEAHGGSIDVASRVGEGTVFSFTLPAAAE